MKLTKRLQRIADLVKNPSGALADVGTDHGFVPIYLAKRFPERPIYGLDVRRQPLERAQANARDYGVEERILFLLSDGLAACHGMKLSTVIITGMGGILMERILKNGADCLTEETELILSPHADRHLVRRILHRLGFRIGQECIIREAGKYYVAIYATWGKDEEYSEREYLFGKTEKFDDQKQLLELRQQERREMEAILRSLGDALPENQAAGRRKEEILTQIKGLEALMQNETVNGKTK